MHTRSIVPHDDKRDTHLVLHDFGGRVGCAWRETHAKSADCATPIRWTSNDDGGVPMSGNTLNKARGSWAAIVAPAATFARAASTPLNGGRVRRRCSRSPTRPRHGEKNAGGAT